MPDAPREPNAIRIRLLPYSGNEDFLVVIWEFRPTGAFPRYTIRKSRLEACGKNARDMLEDFQYEATRSSATQSDHKLQELADRGTQLFHALTTVDTPTPEHARLLKVEKMMAAQAVAAYYGAVRSPKKYRIAVHSDEFVDVPFGLVYPPSPPGDGGPIGGFWAIRHGVAICPDELEDELRVPVRSRSVVATVHRRLHDAAVEATSKGKDWHPKYLCRTREELERAVRQTSTRHRFLYFYAHGQPEGVDLSHQDDGTPDGTVVASALFEWCNAADNPRGRPIKARSARAFAFVNACKSAVDSPRALPGWASAFYSYDRMRLLIGTEVLVPNTFAWLFGLDFLHDLFTSEEEVEEVFERALVKYRPLSLVYTLRSRGRVIFEAGEEAPDPSIDSNTWQGMARATPQEA